MKGPAACRFFTQDAIGIEHSLRVTKGFGVIDPDSFEGGREQQVTIDDESLGVLEKFTEGR